LIKFEFDPKSFERVETNMQRLLREMERAAIEEAQAEADRIFPASQASVPVQTEELKASGRTRKEKDAAAVIEYTAPYATRAHELSSSPKFLQNPLIAAAGSALSRIRRAVKNKVG
jgi:hypothetical protein